MCVYIYRKHIYNKISSDYLNWLLITWDYILPGSTGMPVVWFGAGLDLVHGSPLPLVRHAPHGSLFLRIDLFWIESATKTQNTPTKWTWDPGMLTVSQLAEPKKIQALYWDILRYTEAIEEIRYGSGDVVQPGLRWGMGPRCGEIWHLYGTYMVLIWCLLSAWTFAWWQFLRKLIGTKKCSRPWLMGWVTVVTRFLDQNHLGNKPRHLTLIMAEDVRRCFARAELLDFLGSPYLEIFSWQYVKVPKFTGCLTYFII